MGNSTGMGLPAGLLEVVGEAPSLVILPHDNPDPDALASAATLQYLAKQLAKKEATIALGGIVGRAENRAMLRYLNINLVPVGDLDLCSPDTWIALVDTQPGRTNNSLPKGKRAAIVIDHHPAYCSTDGIDFFDLRTDYGATSTILTEYLFDSHVPVDNKIATALFYGITSETQDLGREATAADMDACHNLYPHTNKRRLAKIENARVPREYFRVFRDAVTAAAIYGKVVVSILPGVRYPDMVAEVADFLLRLDEAEWAAAIAQYDNGLYVSLRTTQREANAGQVLQDVLGSHHAGGHDMIAGGRIELNGRDWRAAAAGVRERLLQILGAQGQAGAQLAG